nr:unnamed protein product [Digitaria exilis]
MSNHSPASARLFPSGRSRGARRASSVSVSAVAPRASSVSVSAVAPRANETPAPSSSVPEKKDERFDWLDQWYPIAPVGELDPRAPHGKTVLGLRVVAWHDTSGSGSGAGEWLARVRRRGHIDGEGRLQCVYHGWCFDGAAAYKFIPQAPALGPPVHKNGKACVASYPCVVQNGVLWFYPRTEPEYKDVLRRKRPPYFAEIDDQSCHTVFGVRDFHYG